jgi:hypothetical protein
VSIGLLPGADRAGAAETLTVSVPTGLGELRNALVIRTADAVIAVGGSWGTLSELGLAMRAGTPTVVLGGWHLRDSHGTEVPIPRADSAAQAVVAVCGETQPAVNQAVDSTVLRHDGE